MTTQQMVGAAAERAFNAVRAVGHRQYLHAAAEALHAAAHLVAATAHEVDDRDRATDTHGA